jgi:glutamate carboxypeptidase
MELGEAVLLLEQLVEIESPTYSTGVEHVATLMTDTLAALGFEAVVLEGAHVRADRTGDGEPLLVVGHTDTVWPEGTLETMPFRVEDGRAYGPGVYDMKACLVVVVAAVSASRTGRPVRVFLTADEEHGSRTARDALRDAADGVAAAVVVEPPSAGGHLKTARKGLGRFRVQVEGKPAHAGTSLADGASAIEELAHQIIRLHALTDDARGVSVNVGVITGGTTENVVAAAAEARLDVRIAKTEDLAAVEAALGALEPAIEGTSITVDGGWTRPPLEPTPESRILFAKAREHGRELGLELEETSSGGGSDANLVAALGVPVLDGLGADGAGAHAWNEHVLVDSIPVRAALLARLLEDPGL